MKRNLEVHLSTTCRLPANYPASMVCRSRLTTSHIPTKNSSLVLRSHDLGSQFTSPFWEITSSPNVACNLQYVDCVTRCIACCAILLEPYLLHIKVHSTEEQEEEMRKSTIMDL